jgi:hypothetical protein
MTKSLPKKLYLFFFILMMMGCTSKPKCDDCPTCGENLMYGNAADEILVDDGIPVIAVDTSGSVDENFAENKIKIEKIYGEQWDFCHCIIANDSLDKVVKSGAEMDDNFMKVFEEVDQKCKAFLVISPNKTPKERADHEKKIRNCLRNAR